MSNIHDYYRPLWPSHYEWNPIQTNLLPANEKTALDLFEELVRTAEQLDRVLGLPDCHDPKKTVWLESVRQRVREHESAKIEKRLHPPQLGV